AVSRTCIDGERRTRRIPISHPQARQLQIKQILRLTIAAYNAVEERLKAVPPLATLRLEGGSGVEHHLRSLLGAHRLSARATNRISGHRLSLLERLMTAWREEGEEGTAYGVMNAITRVATHDGAVSERERYLLSRLGGLLAFQRQHLCPKCFRLLQR